MNPLLTKIAAMAAIFDTTELYRDIRPTQTAPRFGAKHTEMTKGRRKRSQRILANRRKR